MTSFHTLAPQAQEQYLRRLRLIVAMLELQQVSEVACVPVSCPACRLRGQCCIESPSLLPSN